MNNADDEQDIGIVHFRRSANRSEAELPGPESMPEGELGGLLGRSLVLARSATVAICLTHVEVLSKGILFDICIHFSGGMPTPRPRGEHLKELLRSVDAAPDGLKFDAQPPAGTSRRMLIALGAQANASRWRAAFYYYSPSEDRDGVAFHAAWHEMGVEPASHYIGDQDIRSARDRGIALFPDA